MLRFRQIAIAALMLMLPTASLARPNFVVLLVDDAGFMDFGGYGGEARTPTIDRLAEEGVRFSNFHTSPLCATSRAMLITGLDSHRTGVGTIPEVLTKEQEGSPAYALHLQPGVKTIADRLKDAGYETFMTGKWHLGDRENHLPDSHGFDRSFTLAASGADNWEQKTFLPLYEEAPWYEDGQPARLPADFYSSRFLVEKMREYLEGRDRTRPFFAYVAFQAIHIPVQAPREFTDRYEGVYQDGWEATLERRFERAKALGLAPEDAPRPEMHSSLRTWDSLSTQEKAHYERSMMVNAGMLEAMDHYVGELVSYLESTGDLSNTVFIVTSDNGPEFNDPTSDSFFRLWMSQNGYHTDVERMGERGSMGAIGPEWASAAAVPGSLFKMYASEGGTRVPMIMFGPGIPKHEGFHGARTFVTDLAPTISDLAGLPATTEMDGRSLVPVLTGDVMEVLGADEPVGLEVAGNSALFHGRYKLTRNTLPHGDAEWRLYDLQTDPSESRDLSAERPDLYKEMLAEYERYAASAGIVALPKDFDIQAQIGINVRKELISRNLPALAAAGGVVVLAVLATFDFVRRRRHQTRSHMIGR
ncbi:MAG: sulfatase-like hydrolase/transferase [Myxococcota bacterium]